MNNKPLKVMPNHELCRYISENRNKDKTCSDALEIILSRQENAVVYLPITDDNYSEMQAILK